MTELMRILTGAVYPIPECARLQTIITPEDETDDIEDGKMCSRCLKLLPRSHFYQKGRGKLSSRCKVCKRLANNEEYARNGKCRSKN